MAALRSSFQQAQKWPMRRPSRRSCGGSARLWKHRPKIRVPLRRSKEAKPGSTAPPMSINRAFRRCEMSFRPRPGRSNGNQRPVGLRKDDAGRPRGRAARAAVARHGWQACCRRRAERWRASPAYVGQDGSVFDDSVRGNLLAEGARVIDDQLWSALASVGLDHRACAFARGPTSGVGDRGSRTAGATAPPAIARALLAAVAANPRRGHRRARCKSGDLLGPARRRTGARRSPRSPPAPTWIPTLTHCDSVLSVHSKAGGIGRSTRRIAVSRG